MSKFTARIQLHSAAETDYETLNRAIEKDPAILKKKNLWVSPDKVNKGEYNYRGNISLSDVANAVYRAIRKTGRDYSFTVMKSKGG
ncbi:MAG: hypothetical protein ABIU63_11090 [Chitinophagaceae bacterium]